MSATAREIIARQISLELFGPGRATRVFRVDTRDHATAIEHPTIPAYGSFHPEYTSLTLRRKSASYGDDGGTVTDVVCEYESPEFGYSTPIPREDPTWTSWTTKYEAVTVDMPVFYLTAVEVNGQTKRTWIAQPQKILETRVIRSVVLTLNAMAFSAQETIANQQNKLHTIQGRKYRFLSGDIVQRGALSWDVSYSWVDDRGTPASQEPPPTNGDYGANTVWRWYIARPPHGNVIVIPSSDPFDSRVPALQTLVPYTDDALGHLTLPGASKIDFTG